MFKKIKVSVAEGNIVSTYEYENQSLEEAMSMLKDPNVIGFSATRMTVGQYLKGKKPVNV